MNTTQNGEIKMKEIKNNSEYEITMIESGMVRTMTGQEIIDELGEMEAQEALNDENPLIDIIEL